MSLDSPLFLLLFVLFFILWSSLSNGGLHWAQFPGRSISLFGLSLAFIFFKEKWALVDVLVVSTVTFYCGLAAPKTSASLRRVLTYFPILLVLVNLCLCKTLSGWPLFGVSFFSFQLISYTIDVSRGLLTPEKSLLVFLTSSSCFLYISSGPVTRAIKILPQIRKQEDFELAAGQIALFRICLGLAKKAFGDLLGIRVSTYSIHHQAVFGFWPAWNVTLALTAQYYADFSGYTDIALGLGQLLGIRLPENFNLPFLATSPADHWRRWHMSLCDWFRDYVFLPLCVSLGRIRLLPLKWRRAVAWRVVAALATTVTLIGAWHALTLNYLLWAWYNGFLILASVVIAHAFSSEKSKFKISFPGLKWVLIVVTFYLMAIGRLLTLPWSLTEIGQIFREMHSISSFTDFSVYRLGVTFTVLCGVVVPHIFDFYYQRCLQYPVGVQPKIRSTVVFILSAALLFFALLFGSQGRPFLYERI